MDKFSDIGSWKQLLIAGGSELGAKVTAFLPNVLGALAILALGWLIARALEAAAGRVLRSIGLDRAAARLELTTLLERAGLNLGASQIVGRAVFWVLMLTAFLSAVETLGLTAVTNTIDRLITYIPTLVGAGLIALFGLLGARFLGNVVRSAAAAADVRSALRLGVAVQWGVSALALGVAIEHLGVATDILIGPLTAVVGAVTLSAGLAFALGARPIVTHILAGHFLRQSLPREGHVVVQGQQGVVERIGATETILRGDSLAWSVPNARLLDEIVTLS